MTEQTINLRHGLAWIFLCLAFALHVLDEAIFNFLSFYNPTVLALREKIPFMTFPTFNYTTWLTGLIVGIIVSLTLSLFAFRNVEWMIPLSYILSVIMLINGIGHIMFSIYAGQVIPGLYSSPFLLLASIILMITTSSKNRYLSTL
jgi:hypothetical protein